MPSYYPKFNYACSMSDSDLLALLPALTGDDSQNNNAANDFKFEPSSFTLQDRINGQIQLGPNEADFSQWLTAMIAEFVARLPDNSEEYSCEKLIKATYENLLHISQLAMRDGRTVADTVWNQEVPDLVAKTCLFTLGKDPKYGADFHHVFNSLAFEIVPRAIIHLGLNETSDLHVLTRFSVAAGLSGLDLKGAAAASSEFAQPGIAMKYLIPGAISDADVIDYAMQLKKCTVGESPLFQCTEFLEELHNTRCLAWFTDDVIESFFDLLLIQCLLEQYPCLNVHVIPKNGYHANDFSWQHLETALQLNLFSRLRHFSDSNRFTYTRNGCRLSTINLSKLNESVLNKVFSSNLVFIKGCRMHEMVQGALPVPSFTAYVVARSFSEIVSGFDATSAPLLLFKLDSQEHSFYGFNCRKEEASTMGDGRKVNCVLSTTRDHFIRKSIEDPDELVAEFLRVMNHKSIVELSDVRAVTGEASMLAERIIGSIKNKYSSIADLYITQHGQHIIKFDECAWSKLIKYVNNMRTNRTQGLRLLDIGTGTGRDLLYAQNELGLDAVGVDNVDAFITHIKNLEDRKLLKPGSIVKSDMRDLSTFHTSTFDIVRHNASLLHLPIISKGYTADLAVAESLRVLREGGVAYFSVKAGSGIEMLDSNDGFGKRFYQLYDKDLLDHLLSRNGYRVLEVTECTEIRKGSPVKWVRGYATKG